MKILLLCDRHPWPLTNGQNLRIYHYVRHLADRHEFHLGCYADTPLPDELRPLFASVCTWKRPVKQAGAGLRRVIEAFDAEKFVPSCSEAHRELKDWIEREAFDLIWVSGWDFIVNLPGDIAVPVLADAVDDGVLEYWREFKVARGGLRRLRLLKWVAMNALFERRYFGRAQQVLFVSELDAAFFERVSPGTPVGVVNNGVDEHFFQAGTAPVESHQIIFEGNIAFPPNADGLEYFVREILPQVRARIPDAHFSIVGRDPPAGVRALAGPGIEVTGFVDDVRPYLDRAAVFVCPLRKGAGIKNKILQAWSMGKAVVATSVSVGGLAWEEGVNILVRDDPDAFARAVTDLLGDPSRAKRLGDGGRATVINHYTWSRKAAELESLMRQTAARRKDWRHAYS